MQNAFIIFNSITYAQLARETLLRYSIHSRISRLRNGTATKGCRYILYPEGDIYSAYEIITREGIKNLGVERGDSR